MQGGPIYLWLIIQVKSAFSLWKDYSQSLSIAACRCVCRQILHQYSGNCFRHLLLSVLSHHESQCQEKATDINIEAFFTCSVNSQALGCTDKMALDLEHTDHTSSIRKYSNINAETPLMTTWTYIRTPSGTSKSVYSASNEKLSQSHVNLPGVHPQESHNRDLGGPPDHPSQAGII